MDEHQQAAIDICEDSLRDGIRVLAHSTSALEDLCRKQAIGQGDLNDKIFIQRMMQALRALTTNFAVVRDQIDTMSTARRIFENRIDLDDDQLEMFERH